MEEPQTFTAERLPSPRGYAVVPYEGKFYVGPTTYDGKEHTSPYAVLTLGQRNKELLGSFEDFDQAEDAMYRLTNRERSKLGLTPVDRPRTENQKIEHNVSKKYVDLMQESRSFWVDKPSDVSREDWIDIQNAKGAGLDPLDIPLRPEEVETKRSRETESRLEANNYINFKHEIDRDRESVGMKPMPEETVQKKYERTQRVEEMREYNEVREGLGFDPVSYEEMETAIGFWEGMTDVGWGVVPFVGGWVDTYEIYNVLAAAKEINQGTASEEDVKLLNEWWLDTQLDAVRGKTWGATVGEIIGQLPAFGGEIAATGFVYSAGRKAGRIAAVKTLNQAVERIGGKAARDAVQKHAAGRIARRGMVSIAGGVRGAAWQAAIAGTVSGRATASALNNITPDVNLSVDELGKLALVVEGTDMSAGGAAFRGLSDQLIEYGSERLGWMTGKAGLGRMLSRIPMTEHVSAWKAVMTKRWLQGGAGRTAKGFEDLLKKGGWNGVLGEMFEERVGELARVPVDAMTLEEWEYALPDFEQLSAEFVAFLVPGAFNSALSYGAKIGDYKGAKSQGEKVLKNRADQIKGLVKAQLEEESAEAGAESDFEAVTGEAEAALEQAREALGTEAVTEAEEVDVPEVEPGGQTRMFAPPVAEEAAAEEAVATQELYEPGEPAVQEQLDATASEMDLADERGVNHQIRPVPADRQTPQTKALTQTMAASGVTVVPVDITTQQGVAPSRGGFVLPSDPRTVYVQETPAGATQEQAQEIMDSNVQAVVMHELTHGIERENQPLFEALVSLMPAGIQRGINDYRSRESDQGGTEISQAEKDKNYVKLVSEGLAMVFQAESESGNIIMTDPANRSILQQVRAWVRRMAVRLGLPGRQGQMVQTVVDQILEGKDISQITLPKQEKILERARRRGLVPQDIGVTQEDIAAEPDLSVQFAPRRDASGKPELPLVYTGQASDLVSSDIEIELSDPTAGETAFLSEFDDATVPTGGNERTQGRFFLERNTPADAAERFREKKAGKEDLDYILGRVNLRSSGGGRVYLSAIASRVPNRGDGTVLLKYLTDLADKHGVSIRGKVEAFGSKGLPQPKLRAWYERHGFEVSETNQLLYEPSDGVQFAPAPAENTPEFRRWFKDSKVVDEQGNPLVVYHGSVEKGLTRFDLREAVEVQGGLFFSSNEDVAYPYTYERAYGDVISEDPLGEVVEAYLSLQNPMEYRPGNVYGVEKPDQRTVDAIEMGKAIDRAKENGHDGMVVRDIDDTVGQYGDIGDVWVAFEPTQIKSATGNVGTFDPAQADIRFAPKTSGLTIEDVARGVEAEPGTVLAEDISSDDLVRALENGIQFAPSGSLADVPRIPASFFANKDVFVYFADRMRVGTYTGLNPESGIEIPLQGGPGYPHTSGQEGKAGWAFTDKGMVTRFNNQKRGGSGIGIVALFAHQNLRANATFLRAWIEETKYAISSKKLNRGDAFEEINIIRMEALGTEYYRENAGAKWASLWQAEWTSLKQVEKALAASTFDARGSLFFGWNPKLKGKNKGAKVGTGGRVKKGFPNLTDMVGLMADPSFDGLIAGTVVSAVDFGTAPLVATTAKKLGIEPHFSYPVVVEGRGVGVLERTVDILDVYKTNKKRKDAIRSVSTSMPVVEGQRIADEMQRKEGEGAPRFAPKPETPEERAERLARKKEQNERDEAAIRAGALPSTRGRQRAAARITARRVKEARKEGRAAGLERGKVLQERAEARRDARDETARERRERQELKRRLQQQRAGAEAGYRAGKAETMKAARAKIAEVRARLKKKMLGVKEAQKMLADEVRKIITPEMAKEAGYRDINTLVNEVRGATPKTLMAKIKKVELKAAELSWKEARGKAKDAIGKKVSQRIAKIPETVPTKQDVQTKEENDERGLRQRAKDALEKLRSVIEGNKTTNLREKGSKPLTADEYEAREFALREATNNFKAAMSEGSQERKAIVGQRTMTQGQVSEEIAEEVESASTSEIETEKKRTPFLKRMFYLQLDPTSLIQRITRKFDNSSVLYSLMVTALRRAENSYNKRLQEVIELANEAAINAGYSSLSDALVKTSGTQGEHLVEKIDLVLGGKTYRGRPLGEALHLVLLDPETRRKVIEGNPLSFHSDPVSRIENVTAEELDAIRDQLSPELVAFGEAMKDILEAEIRPSMFDAIRRIRGFEPETVFGYWPISRRMSESKQQDPNAFLDGNEGIGSQMNRYIDNSTQTKERTKDTTNPIRVIPAATTFVEHVDTGLRISEMAETLRLADSVLRSDAVRDAIVRKHGMEVYKDFRRQILEASGTQAQYITPDKILGAVTSNVAQSLLVTNVRTWVLQLTGIPRLLGTAFNPAELAAGVVWAGKNFGGAKEQIADASGYAWRRWSKSAADRYGPQRYSQLVPLDGNQFGSNTVNAVKNLMNMKFSDAYKSWTTATEAIKILDAFDGVSFSIAFGAAKYRLRDQGLTEQELNEAAGELASDAIRNTQNSTSALDLSMGARSMKESAYFRLMYMFSSDPIKLANIFTQSVQMMKNGERAKGGQMFIGALTSAAAAVAWRYVWMAGFGAAMAAVGGDDDDRKAAERAAKAEQAMYVAIVRELSGLTFFGPIVEAIGGTVVPDYPGGDIIDNPVSSVINASISTGKKAYEAYSKLEDFEQDQAAEVAGLAAAKAANELLGVFAGNPFRAIANDALKLADAGLVYDHVADLSALEKYYDELGLANLTDEQKKYYFKARGAMVPIRKLKTRISSFMKTRDDLLENNPDSPEIKRIEEAIIELREKTSEIASKALGTIEPSGG